MKRPLTIALAGWALIYASMSGGGSILGEFLNDMRHTVRSVASLNHGWTRPIVLEEDPSGDTPLHLAARKGRADVAMALLRKGADVNGANHYGITPLHVAAKEGHVDMVHVLIGWGANLNAQDWQGATPLHWAAQNDQAEIAQILVRERADIDALNCEGQTPLHIAARYGRTKVARILIEGGADMNVSDSCSSTPLHYAADYGQRAIVDLLLANDAAVNMKDEEGMTPLDRAGTHQRLGDLLRAHGGTRGDFPARAGVWKLMVETMKSVARHDLVVVIIASDSPATKAQHTLLMRDLCRDIQSELLPRERPRLRFAIVRSGPAPDVWLSPTGVFSDVIQALDSVDPSEHVAGNTRKSLQFALDHFASLRKPMCVVVLADEEGLGTLHTLNTDAFASKLVSMHTSVFALQPNMQAQTDDRLRVRPL